MFMSCCHPLTHLASKRKLFFMGLPAVHCVGTSIGCIFSASASCLSSQSCVGSMGSATSAPCRVHAAAAMSLLESAFFPPQPAT